MTSSKTVLVVDDSKMSRMMIKKIISTNYPDWQVLEAASGEEALETVEGQQVDIMTLDVNMPGMDGITLGTILRKQYPEAHITLVTANIQSAIKEKARAAQLQFLPKPITEDRIMGYLRAASL